MSRAARALARSLTRFVLFAVLPSTLAAAAPPLISDEIAYDHGVRYSAGNESAGRCAMIRVNNQVCIFTPASTALYAHRRLLDGGEVDRNPVATYTQNLGYPFDGYDFDVSDYDGVSIKLAVSYFTGPGSHIVSVVELDPSTLQYTGSRLPLDNSATAPSGLLCRWTGALHAIAWQTADRAIHLNFVAPDGTLAAQSQTIADTGAYDGFDMAFDPSAGWLAYPFLEGGLKLVPISATGVIGDARTLSGANWEDVRIAPVAGRWFVWGNDQGLEHGQFFGQEGEALGDLIEWGGYRYAERCLAVHDSVALCFERSVRQPGLQCRLVDFEHGLLAPSPTYVDSLPTNYDGRVSTRSVAALWAGDSFHLLWTEHDHPTECLIGNAIDRDLPTKYQRVRPDGSVVYVSPKRANVSTTPGSLMLASAGDHFVAVTRDEASVQYLQSRAIDGDVAPVAQANELEAYPFNGDRCSGGETRSLVLREAQGRIVAACQWVGVLGPEASVGTARSYLAELDSLGRSVRSMTFASQWWDNPGDVATRIDCSATSHALVAAWDGNFPSVLPRRSRVWLRTMGPNATQREWTPDTSAPAAYPAVVGFADSILVLWSEQEGGRWSLRRAMLDPVNDLRLDASPFLAEPGSQIGARLIPGPDGALCVWVSNGPSVGDPTEVHAVRVDLHGRLLDAVPLLLGSSSAIPASLQGAWSGYHYVISWQAEGAIHCNRVMGNGRVVDGEGFVVAESSALPGSMAALADGRVAIPYGARMRVLSDVATPIAPVALELSSSWGGITVTWEVSPEYGEASCEVMRRQLRDDEFAPEPPSGYDLLARETSCGIGRHEFLDSSVSTGGRYAYAIGLALGSGEVLWSGPLVAEASASREVALRLRGPNPSRGEASFAFSLPRLNRAARIRILDPVGREVRSLPLDEKTSGVEEWDGRDNAGRDAPTGLYFARLVPASNDAGVRVVLLR